MKAYITKNEVNRIFEELDFELSDECIKKYNHIYENVFNYLEDKWDSDLAIELKDDFNELKYQKGKKFKNVDELFTDLDS